MGSDLDHVDTEVQWIDFLARISTPGTRAGMFEMQALTESWGGVSIIYKSDEDFMVLNLQICDGHGWWLVLVVFWW